MYSAHYNISTIQMWQKKNDNIQVYNLLCAIPNKLPNVGGLIMNKNEFEINQMKRLTINI